MSQFPKKFLYIVLSTMEVKRVLDLALSILVFVAFSPMFVVLAILVHFKLGSPIIFRQRRAGHHGQPFSIYKFRTMTDERDAAGDLLSDEKRLTPFGRFLRSTSLDELPELFNVMVGDMSLVGPRPLFEKYLPYYTRREALRHKVRPGITGWAQINGRNHLPWDERLEMDVWYVENQSFLLDLRILFLTVGKVLKREGVAADPDMAERYLSDERSQDNALIL